MAILDTWHVSMKTPFGDQGFDLTLTDNPPRGVMSGPEGDTNVEDVAFDGDAATFALEVTTPMKMRVMWSVTSDGDTLTGTAKAGIFPAQRVQGTRAGQSGV